VIAKAAVKPISNSLFVAQSLRNVLII